MQIKAVKSHNFNSTVYIKREAHSVPLKLHDGHGWNIFDYRLTEFRLTLKCSAQSTSTNTVTPTNVQQDTRIRLIVMTDVVAVIAETVVIVITTFVSSSSSHENE